MVFSPDDGKTNPSWRRKALELKLKSALDALDEGLSRGDRTFIIKSSYKSGWLGKFAWILTGRANPIPEDCDSSGMYQSIGNDDDVRANVIRAYRKRGWVVAVKSEKCRVWHGTYTVTRLCFVKT